MAKKTKSYLQIARESKGLSREVVAAEANIDVSTLYRYEQNPKDIPPENMNILIDVIDDEYIGYLYLSDNPVAMRFLPGGVQRMGALEAVTTIALAINKLTKDDEISSMQEVVLDKKITEEEAPKYLHSKGKLKEIIKGYVALECADGAEH